MKLSNIRYSTDFTFRDSKFAAVICDINANFTNKKELLFYVNPAFGDYLTCDVYDAFLVALIYPAMYYGESIEIDGMVSKKLYHNITHYVMGIIRDFAPHTHKIINIKVKGFKDAEKNTQLHIGTGFSGGVDSFSTLKDNFFDTNDSEYKIDTLFFFHVGQYGNIQNPKTWDRAFNRFEITREFSKEIGVTPIMMNTNLFEFCKPEWEFQAGVLNRIASVLVFQKALKRYYISNAYTYGEMIDLAHDRVFLEEFSDPYIMPLLSPKGLEIVCDGAQYKRSEKTKRITDIPLTQKYLNVCINSNDDHVLARNCSKCTKCMRTMMTLESLGLLEKYKEVFNLEEYYNQEHEYKRMQLFRYPFDGFARDNVDFARACGMKLPSVKSVRTQFIAKRIITLPYRAIRKLFNYIINKH